MQHMDCPGATRLAMTKNGTVANRAQDAPVGFRLAGSVEVSFQKLIGVGATVKIRMVRTIPSSAKLLAWRFQPGPKRVRRITEKKAAPAMAPCRAKSIKPAHGSGNISTCKSTDTTIVGKVGLPGSPPGARSGRSNVRTARGNAPIAAPLATHNTTVAGCRRHKMRQAGNPRKMA